MDLVKRAGQLKPMLVRFATSPRFDSELSGVIARHYPDGSIADDAMFTAVLDHFALQHRLPSGTTVVEEFVAAHPELTSDEQEMLLGWRDVVEGIFEVTGKDRGALALYNFMDELTYRTRSNLGSRALAPLKKGMIIIGRVVRMGEDWMVSGHLTSIPAAMRDQMLVIAAEEAMRRPEAVFRNPAKLAEARRTLARHHEAFVDLFGSDLIVVPGVEVADKVQAFHRHVTQQVSPDTEPAPLHLDLPDDLLDASGVAIYTAAGEGMSFLPGYDLLDELFRRPALLSRRLYREVVSGFLNDAETSPEPLRRLAARDPANASAVFTRLLKRKGGFDWDTDGEQLLRQHKPSFFDGTRLPRTVVLSPLLADALQRSR